MIFNVRNKLWIIVRIKYEEQLGWVLVKSDNFLDFQIFNTRFEFFDEFD